MNDRKELRTCFRMVCQQQYLLLICCFQFFVCSSNSGIASGSEDLPFPYFHSPDFDLEIYAGDINKTRYGVSTPEQYFANMTKIESPCEASLEIFAKHASSFLLCAVRYSRPVMFCEHCVEEYVKFTSTYNFIMSLDSQIDTGKKCKDALTRSDRIQVIVKTNNFLKDIWDSSYCSRCFEFFRSNNGSVEYQLSNRTFEFMDLFNQTTTCMLNFTDGELLDVLVFNANHTFNHSACSACLPLYKKLNRLYNSFYDGESLSNPAICMDVVDAMNFTRQRWSSDFQCLNPHRDYFYVLISTLCIAILPIVFYLSSRIHSERQEFNIRHQQRLLEPIPSNNTRPPTPSTPSEECESDIIAKLKPPPPLLPPAETDVIESQEEDTFRLDLDNVDSDELSCLEGEVVRVEAVIHAKDDVANLVV